MNLGPEHDSSECEEEQTLQAQEDHENDRDRRRERAAVCPLPPDTGEEMEAAQSKSVERDQSDVHCKEHKESLVFLSNAVIDPWAVVIHLPDTSLTNTAVVSALWFNAATLRTLVYDLSGLQL